MYRYLYVYEMYIILLVHGLYVAFNEFGPNKKVLNSRNLN